MLLVVKDLLTKTVILVPTQQEITSEMAATILLEKVYAYYGLPDKVVSDRGSQFVSRFMRAVYQALGIKLAASTACHPQTDGATERANQEVEVILRALIKEDQSDWVAALPLAQHAMNTQAIRNTNLVFPCTPWISSPSSP